MYGPRGLGDASIHWRLQVRQLVLSSLMLTDTNLFVCADCDFNKALSSGLVAEEHTQLLLEIPLGKSDYRVVLSEQNLRLSHLWSCVEEVEQGIPVPPLELVLPILRLRHAIHVVFGSSDL